MPKRKAAGAAVLQPDVTRSITRALFREWAKSGYAALTIEAVAKRAGVGKAAIYRRWPSKLEMVSSLLTEVGVELLEVPDTGSLRGDIAALLEGTLTLLRRPLVTRILPDLHAEMRRTPELASTVRSRVQRERRAKGQALLRRAMDRGELSPAIDIDLALDLMGALVYWRMIVTGQPLSSDYVERLTSLTLGGLRGLSE
ncbi:TetR/AcrR family transcriptional regulator [Melittangium boletus]|uniref:TetR family transcriptional regulator n=1 Tax=Melittangium boletus DSM 14713 TaxID=1294270 RepID=A0A250IQA6_9BACT|nr:TetR/AcrR family transcriptional regulator [Melittangium boletus]ATB33433.1 TetR family transcriptional regulator [Melittangium boletus DSM 14713]